MRTGALTCTQQDTAQVAELEIAANCTDTTNINHTETLYCKPDDVRAYPLYVQNAAAMRNTSTGVGFGLRSRNGKINVLRVKHKQTRG